jgi:hypothetical protein
MVWNAERWVSSGLRFREAVWCSASEVVTCLMPCLPLSHLPHERPSSSSLVRFFRISIARKGYEWYISVWSRQVYQSISHTAKKVVADENISTSINERRHEIVLPSVLCVPVQTNSVPYFDFIVMKVSDYSTEVGKLSLHSNVNESVSEKQPLLSTQRQSMSIPKNS